MSIYLYWLGILIVPAVAAFFLWIYLRRAKKRKDVSSTASLASLRNLTPPSGRPALASEGKISKTGLSKSTPPDMLMERVLNTLKNNYADFVSLLRFVLSTSSAADLLRNGELLRRFSHIDLLLQLSSRSAVISPSPIGKKELESSGILQSPDIRATIVSIVRILQEMPEIREKGGDQLNSLVDAFLEKL
jgi:hypothetical protein